MLRCAADTEEDANFTQMRVIVFVPLHLWDSRDSVHACESVTNLDPGSASAPSSKTSPLNRMA